MELKDFIREAIVDIANGIAEADEKIKDMGGLVNPGTHLADKHESRVSTGEQSPGCKNVPVSRTNPGEFVAPRTSLNFDIAVSATNNSSGEANIGAKIWVVNASLGGDRSVENKTVSKLSFAIDVVLPHDREQLNRIGKVRSN